MKIKNILSSCISSLLIIIIFTSLQVSAEKPNYNIDISLFPEGYAKFKIYVDHNDNLGDVVIQLPVLNCEDNYDNLSNLRRKLKVTDIPDRQTEEGTIALDKNCHGVGIIRPFDISNNSTFSFTYQNFDWKWRPEQYPFDSYDMPIFISFPLIKMEDSITVSIRILLPPNMNVTNFSAHLLWSNEMNNYTLQNHPEYTIEKQGNQRIIVFEKNIPVKDNKSPAIFMPLEFEREDSMVKIPFVVISVFLIVIIILLANLIYKNVSTDLGILTIVALLFSFYQFLIIDKPVGVTTYVDESFLIFLGLSLVLFICNTYKKLRNIQNPQTYRNAKPSSIHGMPSYRSRWWMTKRIKK